MDSASCRVIRGRSGYQGKQGLSYFAGVGAENAGAQHLCLHLLVIPAGGRARAHLHENHESAIYLVQGDVDVWWGEKLREHARMQGGDFMYIPPGVPHLPVNASATDPAQAVIARTDPNEQESVVLLPELDALVDSGALPHLDIRRGAGSRGYGSARSRSYIPPSTARAVPVTDAERGLAR